MSILVLSVNNQLFFEGVMGVVQLSVHFQLAPVHTILSPATDIRKRSRLTNQGLKIDSLLPINQYMIGVIPIMA